MTPLEFLTDHTYRMVLLGTSSIGLVAGALGVFAYVRKQSLMSDVISHAALPGILTAFLAAVTIFRADGRTMMFLLIGATITGTLAVLLANLITRVSKIRIDTAMAIILAMFFGAGMLLMRVIDRGTYPGKGGIHNYLFGNASVITYDDLWTSLIVGSVALATMVTFWKEYALRSFDPDQSSVMGFSPRVIDPVMFTSIVLATVIGIKAVGLVLMVAFIVTPPAAARQWTRRLSHTVWLSALIGAIGSAAGAYLSIAMGNVPTGPVIVLVLFVIFAVSLVAAPERGLISRAIQQTRAKRQLTARLIVEDNPATPATTSRPQDADQEELSR